MYSYHNRIKQRIKNGELIGIKEGDGEFPIILLFSTPPFSRPIRPHALWRYQNIPEVIELLNKMNHDTPK